MTSKQVKFNVTNIVFPCFFAILEHLCMCLKIIKTCLATFANIRWLRAVCSKFSSFL